MKAHRNRSLVAEEIALAIGFVLVLIGVGATNFAPDSSYRYWLWLTGLIALVGTAIGALKVHGDSSDWHDLTRLLTGQLVHWAGVFAAIACIYLLLQFGRLNYEGTGLITALVLGLATFLDGFYRVGWRFALLGISIVFTTVVAAYVEAYVWPLLFMVGVLWLVTFVWERHRTIAQVERG